MFFPLINRLLGISFYFFDENRNALHCFNQRAIEDCEFGTNFALLFTSRYFEPLKDHLMSSDGNCTFRAEILNMLQQNYSSKFLPAARHMSNGKRELALCACVTI